jgi:hypothetical protein
MAEIPATIHVSLILEMYFIDFSEMESKERKMKHGRIDPRFISCEIEVYRQRQICEIPGF